MAQDDETFEGHPWVVIGAGRLGRTLGLLAQHQGIEVAATWNRSPERAKQTREALGGVEAFAGEPRRALDAAEAPRVVWLTVVDDAVEEVARSLAPHVEPSDVVVHSSGVASSRVLREAGLNACHVGSIHVLQAITDPRRAVETLAESTWSVEGDEEVVDFGRWLLGGIGVEPLVMEADAKVLYHASAVTTANLMVALMDAAFEMAEGAGLSREQARAMLIPLARSSVENLSEQPTSEALSGPVARGDRSTLAAHQAALEALGEPELLAIYETLTERAKRLVPAKWSDED
jgi:predicted short-subunit dehydrogenase-like oxidoreductase (DUF2520 family)